MFITVLSCNIKHPMFTYWPNKVTIYQKQLPQTIKIRQPTALRTAYFLRFYIIILSTSTASVLYTPLRLKLRMYIMYSLCVLRNKIPDRLFFRLLWPCITNVGRRERNQLDATNLMFIIKLLSQHVSGIIMPIIRRTRVCTAAYGVLHWLWWLWLCGAGTRAVCTVKVTVRLANRKTVRANSLVTAHSFRVCKCCC